MKELEILEAFISFQKSYSDRGKADKTYSDIGKNVHYYDLRKDKHDYPKIINDKDFYLILDHEQHRTYAGIVYVIRVNNRIDDLHWYILDSKRKRGLLTKSLREIIFPHLFKTESEIKISINPEKTGNLGYRASSSVAIELGFKKTTKINYLLKKQDFRIENEIDISLDNVVKKLKKITLEINLIEEDFSGIFDSSEKL